jgi:hypothetical protein
VAGEGSLSPACAEREPGMMADDLGSEWQRKGTTLSDKTARKEFGLTQDEIIETIRAGSLQYRQSSIHENARSGHSTHRFGSRTPSAVRSFAAHLGAQRRSARRGRLCPRRDQRLSQRQRPRLTCLRRTYAALQQPGLTDRQGGLETPEPGGSSPPAARDAARVRRPSPLRAWSAGAGGRTRPRRPAAPGDRPHPRSRARGR